METDWLARLSKVGARLSQVVRKFSSRISASLASCGGHLHSVRNTLGTITRRREVKRSTAHCPQDAAEAGRRDFGAAPAGAPRATPSAGESRDHFSGALS